MIDDTALLWLSKLGSPNTWMTDLDTKTNVLNVFARIDKKKNDKMSYVRKANRRGKKLDLNELQMNQFEFIAEKKKI